MVTRQTSDTGKTPPDSGCAIGVAVLVVILLLTALGQCSKKSSDPNNAVIEASAGSEAIVDTPSPTPAAIEPLNPVSMSTGAAHFRLAMAAEGISGAMIYSQNCFDALGQDFSWDKLDRCGGFDMLAAKTAEQTEFMGLDNEVAYFQSEAAAGRYLAAATSAGETPERADQRLVDLQSRISRMRPVITASESALDNDSEDADEPDATGNDLGSVLEGVDGE